VEHEFQIVHRARGEIDLNQDPQGIKASDAQMRMPDISRNQFHGQWNYTFHPQTTLTLQGLFYYRFLAPHMS